MSTTVSRIEKEYIFNFLIQNKVEVEVKYGESDAVAVMLGQSVSELKLDIFPITEELTRFNLPIQVFFYFQSTHHTFNSTVIKSHGNHVIIKNPDNIVKNLARKHERVNMKGTVKVSFEVIGQRLPLDYPECKLHYYPDTPPVSADFSGVKLDTILTKFKQKMANYVSQTKILMVRNFKPARFEEYLALNTGKIVYVPDTHTDIPLKRVIDELPTLIKDEWYSFESFKNNTNNFHLNKALSGYLTNLKKDDIYSYALFPVLYRNYIVALIYIYNNHQKSTIINANLLKYVFQFTKILTYTLKENGYFTAEEGKKEKLTFPIFDLSPGGLGLSVEGNILENRVKIGTNYKMIFEIEGRPVRANAKLVREFQRLSKKFYGFLFLDIRVEDAEFLQKYLKQFKETQKK